MNYSKLKKSELLELLKEKDQLETKYYLLLDDYEKLEKNNQALKQATDLEFFKNADWTLYNFIDNVSHETFERALSDLKELQDEIKSRYQLLYKMEE